MLLNIVLIFYLLLKILALLENYLEVDVHPYAVGFGGLASAVISTYQVFKDV